MTIAFKSTPLTANYRLGITLFLAFLIHAIVILGISFSILNGAH
jgi:hypothetical protein